MRQRAAMLALSACVALAASAHAHHSHFYDECARVAIEGQVERVEFKNPHNLFGLRLDDGTAWVVDWLSLTRLTSAGLIGGAKDAIVPGARVAVTGYRIRDATEIRKRARNFKGNVDPNTVEARSIRRADGSFTWAPTPSAYPPKCDR